MSLQCFSSQRVKRILPLTIFYALLIPAFAQSNLAWTGSASCTASAIGDFQNANGTLLGHFEYTETQTWAMTGAAPSSTGVSIATSFPATWTVEGTGFKQMNGMARIKFSTSLPPQSRPLLVSQFLGSPTRWRVAPDAPMATPPQATSVDGKPFNVIDLPFPDTTAFSLPLDNPGIDIIPPPITVIVAQQPGLNDGFVINVTERCKWHFGAPASGSRFVPLPACRAWDTRNNATIGNKRLGIPSIPGFLSAWVTTPFVLAGTCGLPAVSSTVKAYSINVTAVPVIGSLGNLFIKPTGQDAAALSILNATDGFPTAHGMVIGASSGSVDVMVSDYSHVIIDVNGYFDDNNGYAFFPLTTPCRAVDTQNPTGPTGGPMLPALTRRDFALRSTCNIPAAASVQAYALNVTVTPDNTLGGLIGWAGGPSQPSTSVLNAYDGRKKSNMAIVQAGTNGDVSFLAFDATHLAVDIIGYFAPQGSTAPAGGPGELTYRPVTGCLARTTGLAAMTVQDLALQPPFCGVPYWVKAYLLNFTVIPNGIPLTSLSAGPTGQAMPATSILSATDAEMTTNAAIVLAGANGSISASALNQTNLWVDVNGYFAK